ncbi:hypothetical protein HPB50_018663 [Hyalomma asiaticum]|uniref:Uncharacterized protein n=1 Tax=Hyalomma asiaticum TaxID=266040 RepID=A0ACB7SII1_HYAAI|nr:hypothetical protein HPB50_018663 [Hyalomma asiaticum]
MFGRARRRPLFGDPLRFIGPHVFFASLLALYPDQLPRPLSPTGPEPSSIHVYCYSSQPAFSRSADAYLPSDASSPPTRTPSFLPSSEALAETARTRGLSPVPGETKGPQRQRDGDLRFTLRFERQKSEQREPDDEASPQGGGCWTLGFLNKRTSPKPKRKKKQKKGNVHHHRVPSWTLVPRSRKGAVRMKNEKPAQPAAASRPASIHQQTPADQQA